MYEYVAPEPTGNADRDLGEIYDALAQICKQLNLDLNNPDSKDVSRVLFPVGHVIIQADDTDPNKYFYGKWVKIGQGKCLVGKDETDEDFNIIGKTGGSKEMQAHTHNVTLNDQAVGFYDLGGSAGYTITADDIAVRPEITTANAGTGDSGNLQPYLVVNFWKRME